MIRHLTHFQSWLVIGLTLPFNVGFCSADETSTTQAGPTTEPAAMIVLRDGGVLTGTVTRVEDRYLIQRGGTEIQVPAGNVLVACRSLEEGYEARRAEIAQPSAESHLSLATWCLQHGLKSQASRELAQARQLEPSHPRLSLLERRLASANSRVTSSKNFPPERLPNGSSMSRASASSELDPTPPGTDIESLPGPVVERFTRKIQPILVNNCTTSGCHQRGGAQQFQLDRALLHGLANRRSTMRNLTAALTLVDGEQPQLSPLLIVPRQTHGGMSAPIFGPRQAELFNHLVDWVSLVTRSEPTQPLPLAANMPSGEITLANNTEPISGSQNGALPESDFLTSQDVQQQFSLRAKPLVRFGARLEAWRPKDEFDPEIFNRQQRVQPEVDAEDNASNSIVPTEHR